MNFNKGLVNLRRIMSSNDDFKIKIIENRYKYDISTRDVVKIICSIENDNIKEHYISYLIDNGFSYYRIIDIICSLKDDEYKNIIVKEYDKYDLDTSDAIDIVNSMGTDYIKKILFNHLEYSFNTRDLAKIVCNIDDEEFKKEVIDNYEYYYFDNEDITNVVASLKDDDYKKKFLDVNEDFNSYCKACIIYSINDDEYKYNAITKSSKQDFNPDDISFIIDGLKDTDKYVYDILEHYKEYGFDLDVLAGVVSLLPNEKKEAVIFENSYGFTPIQLCVIVKSFKDEKERYRILDKLYCNGFLGDLTNNKKICLPSDMTIGIEIESEGKNSSFVNTDIIPTGWDIHIEISLKRGTEVVSPVLHSGDEDQIVKICSLLKSFNQEINSTCAGHVHIGADYFKGDIEYFKVLVELFANVERIMFLISNEEGQIPRNRVFMYASPITNRIVDVVKNQHLDFDDINTIDEFLNTMHIIQASSSKTRYSSMNFENMREGTKDTIEFRFPNGTIESDVWIDNINLLGGLLWASKKVVDARRKKASDLTYDDVLVMYCYENIKSTNISERDRLICLLNLLPSDINGKIYLNRYDVNSDLVKDMDIEEVLEGISSFRPINITNCYDDSVDKKLIKTK